MKLKTILLMVLLAVAAICLATIGYAATTPPPAQPTTVKVLGVVDGDTFSFDPQATGVLSTLSWKVRVRGIDTPEKGSKAKCQAESIKAEEASLFARRLIAASKNTVTISHIEHDKYGGRIVATVTLLSGKDYSTEMIAAGLARPYDGGKKSSWC